MNKRGHVPLAHGVTVEVPVRDRRRFVFSTTMSSPVTPQRIPRSSVSTPYTPLSLHSFTSNSSTLTTPSSIQSARARSKRLNFTSPNTSIVSENGIGNNKKTHKSCLSDIADSWRSRANEHGIKVSASQSTVGEDSHYGDDEGKRIYVPACDN